MLEALLQVETARPSIVIFMTDGLATEGVVETDRILDNVDDAAPESARLFTFGVGDDVNTILLDRMARDHRGASAYVRPGQSIDEEVSSFYAKVSTPLLSDLDIDYGRVRVEDTYPYPLPDLFAGTQIIMVGRYRRGGDTTVTLRGVVNGREHTFEYGDVRFRDSGGEAFIPRLWATRKVGYLLNQVRLHGESRELVEEIVELSVRYGIMTPYTSFLVNEDEQVFSEEGRSRTVEKEMVIMATPAAPSGQAAVDEAEKKMELERSDRATGTSSEAVKVVRDKAFLLREGMWIDTTYDMERMKPIKVGFMSDDYFALIGAHPEWGAYLSIGERVLVVLGGKAYQVVGEGQGEKIDIPTPRATNTQTVARETPLPRATNTQTIAQATPVPLTTATLQEPTATPPSRGNLTICEGAAAAMVLPILAAILLMKKR
jgi:Ca-activated chloride channel family protein